MQKVTAPNNGVKFRQSSIGTIRSSLATSYDVWRRRATSLLLWSENWPLTNALTHAHCHSLSSCGPKNWKEKNLVRENFWFKTKFNSKKILCQKQILIWRIFGPIKIFGPKNFFGSKKIFGSKKFLAKKKNLCPKKILGPKKFWVQKSFGSKTFWV